MLTVGKIVGGAFGLVKDKPGAVLVWSLFYMASLVAMGLTIGSMFGAVAVADKDPMAAIQQMNRMFGMILLVELGMLVLFIVLFTATQRAVLRPEQGSLAYMRLGMDELKMFALAFVMLVIFYVGMIVLMLVLFLIAGALALATGPAGGFVSALIVLCGLVAAIFWFQVRISLMFPLTLMTGNIAIGEGWRLSRGRFWTLFGGYLVINLIIVALWTGVMAATMGPYFTAIVQAGNDPVAMQQAMQAQMQQYASFGPQSILALVLMSLAGGLGLALFGGAIATAARELTIDREGMAETFA
jgi:hypothetical protein